MDAALVVTWSEPIPGREKQALDYAAESDAYWNQRASEGRCSPPEWFVFTSGNGMWLVKGDREALLALFLSPESQRLATEGELLLQDFTCEFVRTGPAAEAHVREYAEVARQLALV